jgi:8-oxo-dGTP pyrophosphatase MutT (NUDIX family)
VGRERSEQANVPGSGRDALSTVRLALKAHLPRDHRETAAKQRILEQLEVLEDPFDESAGPVHLTGSAIVVGRRGTVLHVHKRLARWMQPGGHLASGEQPSDAAIRESREETGLQLSHPAGTARLIHVDVHEAAKGHTHLDLRYLLVAPDTDPSPPAGESPQVRWFSWDEAEDVADPALIGALRVARLEPEAGQIAAI